MFSVFEWLLCNYLHEKLIFLMYQKWYRSMYTINRNTIIMFNCVPEVTHLAIVA
jgi:hypothetical protein